MKQKHLMISDLIGVLAGRADRFCNLAEKTRKDFSEEAIHDFRVSTRRLLIVELLIGPDCRTGGWRKKSRRLLKQLSRLRDLQVLQIRFHDEPTLFKLLSQDIEHEIERLRQLKKTITVGDLEKKINRSIKLYRKASRAHPKRFARGICSQWQQIRAEMDGIMHAADQQDYHLLHRLRIQFKSLRYLTEILIGANLIDSIEFEHFKEWQNVLGNIQDLVVATKWLEGRNEVSSIRQQLLHELDQQVAACWAKQASLVALLKRLDVMVADSSLSCH